jgi:hypothetical protein
MRENRRGEERREEERDRHRHTHRDSPRKLSNLVKDNSKSMNRHPNPLTQILFTLSHNNCTYTF